MRFTKSVAAIVALCGAMLTVMGVAARKRRKARRNRGRNA